MDSLTTTCLLACINLAFCAAALWLTRYPALTVFHLALMGSAIGFGVRPLLSASEGGYTILPLGGYWEPYNRGLLQQLFFDGAYILGYLLNYRRHLDRTPRPVNAVRERHLLIVVGVGLATVVAIHILSYGTWLPTRRSQALTMLFPGGPVLFRLATTTLSVTFPLAALLYFNSRRRALWLGVTSALLALTALTLLYQRGLVLSGVIFIGWLLARYRGVTYGKLTCLAAIALIGLVGLRPLARVIVSGGEDVGSRHVASGPSSGLNFMSLLKSTFLFTGNYSLVDTWPVAETFVEQNGLLNGKTLLLMPASFTPAWFRWKTGFTTAVDRLNYFYYGDTVVQTQWGFNVNLAQDIFLNGGPAFLFVGIIPGVLTWFMDRWLYTVRRIGVFSVFAAAAIFSSGGFTADPGMVLSYVLFYLMIGRVIAWVSEPWRRTLRFGGWRAAASEPSRRFRESEPQGAPHGKAPWPEPGVSWQRVVKVRGVQGAVRK